METLAMWYFTLIIAGGSAPGYSAETFGPFHKEYACQKVLEGKVKEVGEQVRTYTSPGVTIISAVPCTAPVELTAIFTNVDP